MLKPKFSLFSSLSNLSLYTFQTPCLSTPVGTAWLIKENVKFFKYFPKSDLGVAFPMGTHQENESGMIWKFSDANWQIPVWLKNIEVTK